METQYAELLDYTQAYLHIYRKSGGLVMQVFE